MIKPSMITAAALIGFAAVPAAAQSAPPVNKTWVSSTGADTGSCQLAAPCKTFAYAISETNAGGEVDVKDSGAFGAFTIDKNISIVAAGVVASVGIGPDNKAITVAGSGNQVDLVGLTVNTHSRDLGVGVYLSCDNCVLSLDHVNIEGNHVGLSNKNQDSATIILSNSHVALNFSGLENGKGTCFIGNNTITENTNGITGKFSSFGNNEVRGNADDVTKGSSVTSVSTM